MKDQESQYLRRREASAYLREQHGICRAPATLAKLAVIGGGPRFRHVGRVPIYPVIELDAYAAAITSAEVFNIRRWLAQYARPHSTPARERAHR
jgi:hypothetical protein